MTTSNQMTERESMIQIYSDFHKDAYGFRPRGVNYHEFTLEELKADFDRFSAISEQNAREEERANEACAIAFEARVQQVIDMGAGDRETALCWIMDSYEDHVFDYGTEGVIWELGTGFSTKYSLALSEELLPIIQKRVSARLADRYSDVA